MLRAPGVTLAKLSLWVQSLGKIGEVDAVQHTLEQLVEAILANRINRPEFSSPDVRNGLVVNHPSCTMLEILESLDQNERNRTEDQHTAYSFDAFIRLFEENDLVKLNTDAVFLIMSTWNDPRPFKNAHCIQEIVSMDTSSVFVDIGPKLRVCLSKKAFERVRTITMRSQGNEMRQELIPQLIQNSNLVKNEGLRERSNDEKTQARSCVIRRMCEWLATVVFVQLDGVPDPNARPPYSLLRRQVNPLSLIASGLIEPRNREDASKADALHVQRWAISQNRLRFPNQYLDVLSLLLAELAGNSDDCNEQRELYMESVDIDLNLIDASTNQINNIDREIAETIHARAILLNLQAAAQVVDNTIAEQIQQYDKRLGELGEDKKKSEGERKLLKSVRIGNMRGAIQAIINSPELLATLKEHHRQMRMLYREVLMYNRIEGVPLRDRINDLQFAACIYQILSRLRGTTGDLEQAQACLEEILKLRQARLNEAPQELIWELQTLASVYEKQQKWDQAEYMYTIIITRVLPVYPNLSASIMYSQLGQVLFRKGHYRRAVLVTNEAIRIAEERNNGSACTEIVQNVHFLTIVYRAVFGHLDFLATDTERCFKEALETADEMDERAAAAHACRRLARSSSGGSGDTRRQLLEEEEEEEDQDQDDDQEGQDHVRRARSKQVTRQILRNQARQLRILQYHIESGSSSYYDESKSRSTMATDYDEEYDDDKEEEEEEDYYSEEEDDDDNDGEEDYDDEYEDDDDDEEEDDEEDTYATTSDSDCRDTLSNPSTYSSQFRRTNDNLELFPCPENWQQLCSTLRFVSFEPRPEFTPYFHVYQKVRVLRDHCAHEALKCESYLASVVQKLQERQSIEEQLKELRAQYEVSASQLPELPIPSTTPEPLKNEMIKKVLDHADLGYRIASLYKHIGDVEKSLVQFKAALEFSLVAVFPPNAKVLTDLDQLASEYIRYRQYANAVALFDKAVKILRLLGKSAICQLSFALANQATALELKGEMGSAVNLYEESLQYSKQLPPSNDTEKFKLKVMNRLFFCYASTHQLDKCLKIGREIIELLPPGCRDACIVRQSMSEFLLQANRVDEAMAEYVIVEKEMRALLDDPRPLDFTPVLRLGISLHLARRDLVRAEKLCREAADILKHYPADSEQYRFGCDIYVPILLARAQDILDALPGGTSTNDSEDEATLRRMRRDRKAALGLVDEAIATCNYVLGVLEESTTEWNPVDERYKAAIYCSLGRAYVLKGRLRSAHDNYGKAFSIMTRLVNNDLKHPDVVAIHAEMDRIIERAELVGNPEEEDGGSNGIQNSSSSSRENSSRSVQEPESHQPEVVVLHPLERSVEERKENSANFLQDLGGANPLVIAPLQVRAGAGPNSSSIRGGRISPSIIAPHNNMNTSDMDSDGYQESAIQRIQQSNMDDEARKNGFMAVIGDTEDLNLAMESRDQVRDLKSTRNTNSNNNINITTSNLNKKTNKRKDSDLEICADLKDGSETSSVQDMAFIPSSSNPNKRKGLFKDWFIGARKSYLSSATSSQHDSAISSTAATLSPRGLVSTAGGHGGHGGGKYLRNAGESSSNVGVPEAISNRLNTITYARPRNKRKWSLLATCFCFPPEPPTQ